MALVRPILLLLLWHGLRRLRSIGLLVVGIADNSVIPMPGSTDVLTIWLSATERRYWPYYAAMATLGALLGGYITYDLARRGGKETLERRKAGKARRLYRSFERWGFSAVAVPAIPASLSHRSLLAGGRRLAISSQEIPGGSRSRPGNPLHRPRRVGSSLRGCDRRLLYEILQAGTDHSDRPSRAGSRAGPEGIPPLSQSRG
jgi:membrane protein YqaA with SNARE-associated domain